MASWSGLYGPEVMPDETQISAFINSGLWRDLNEYIQSAYGVAPAYSYSKCPAQKGWNVKYQKAGRSLCTLYPMNGYFIALVTIGAKEQAEAELVLNDCCDDVRDLYARAVPCNGSRWLMIAVKDNAILRDVKTLIAVRRPVKK
jgi:hypothetical protein